MKRFAAFSAALLLFMGLFIPVFIPMRANAAILTTRSINLSSSAVGTVAVGAEGTGGNGQKAKHTVTFTMGTSGATVGSIVIMYCTSPVLQTTCTTPTGMTAQNLTAATVSGLNVAQGFTLDTTTSNASLAPSADGVCNGSGTTRVNCVAVKRATAAAETGTPAATIEYGGGASDYITNPTTANYSFYARILVFSDTAFTTRVDYGGVAASTAQQITVTAKVAERLEFSVGVGSPAGDPPAPSTNCVPLSDSGALTLGDANGVLSTAQAYDAHSYFRVNSNTTSGTKIYYSGDTLKNGSNVITAMPPNAGAGTSSVPGTKQFGIAIDQDDTAGGDGYSFTHLTKTVGAYDEGHGTITTGGTAKLAFETASITTPVEIATSTSGIACDTGSVRYIANVSTDTPAGIYTTTITYIATGTY
jgi:hypothetical protein